MRSSSYGIRSFTLQYFNSDTADETSLTVSSNYTDIEYFSYGSTAPSSWNITVQPYEGYHRYYRFEFDRGSRDSSSYYSVQPSNIVITGTQLV